MSAKTLKTALDWVHQQFESADLYYGHGTDNAWDEAVCLILFIMGLQQTSGDEVLAKSVSEQQWSEIERLTHERIQTRKPLPYLIHHAWFAGLEFYVDERVLIPRSPLAELIEQQFQPWVGPNKVHRILDLCTGGGCIAIACAHYLPNSQVDASDISAPALEVAKQNIDQHHLQDRVHIIESDLFENIKNRYDIVISNPPYVDAEDMADLPKEYHHEPTGLALAAGHDGLDIVNRMLEQAKCYLNPGGVLIVEVGNSAAALSERYPELPFTWLEFSRGGDGVFLLGYDELL